MLRAPETTRCPGRETRKMAGGGGIEPPLQGPEPCVLPLDDPPAALAIVRAAALECQGRKGAELARLLQVVLQRAARLEAGHPAGRNLDGLAGARVAAVALGSAADQERAEAADGDPAAALERVEDDRQPRFLGFFGRA